MDNIFFKATWQNISNYNTVTLDKAISKDQSMFLKVLSTVYGLVHTGSDTKRHYIYLFILNKTSDALSLRL